MKSATLSIEKITKLTPEQEARFPEFVAKWTSIGLSTQPADRPRAEAALKGLYALAELREPRIIWLPCPLSAGLSSVVCAQIVNSSAVDSAVGSAVYSAVDSAVRSAVGSAVGSAVRFFGGSLWAGYAAWADYFNAVLGIAIDRSYLESIESCGCYWLLNGICFASERPCRLNLDDRGRLHCGNGQSIGYPSGWGLWHWHGVQVPERVILSPELLTPREIIEERNAEVRRVMIERYGQDRFVIDSGAAVLDRGADGELLAIDLPGDPEGQLVALRLRCPSTSAVYIIRVPPDQTSFVDAKAWTFGLTKEQYVFAQET